jgi:hypothetical protein
MISCKRRGGKKRISLHEDRAGIDVAVSKGDYTHNRANECNGDLSPNHGRIVIATDPSQGGYTRQVRGLSKESVMKYRSVLLIPILSMVSMLYAQNTSTQAPATTGDSQVGSEQRERVMEMHKQQMDVMKGDVEKMQRALAEMKANLATIKDTNELARWRNNVDLWQTMVDHMEQMQKQMEVNGR